METTIIIRMAISLLTLSLATACTFFSEENTTSDGTVAYAPENPAVYELTGKDADGRITYEDFERLREDLAGSRNSENRQTAEGNLPDGIEPGSRKGVSEVYVIDPDEFREIAKLYRENTLQLHAQFGANRVIVSNWVKGITGVAHPEIIWGDGARCELETNKDNVAAVVATPANHEVIVSGHIHYERVAFTMTGCRIHGYYNGSGPRLPPGFQHTLAPNSGQPRK